MTVTADQIGPKFDILVSTRDGSLLPCAGRPPQRSVAQLGQVAYMCSTNPSTPLQESTELQRKDLLTSLSSSQETDRQFTAWPQVQQGDWSGGAQQRIFSGGQNQPTRYWDGLGVIWPITDYLPQRPVMATPDQAEAGAIVQAVGTGATGGSFASAFAGVSSGAYAYAYMQHVAPQHNILAIQTASSLRKIDPIPSSVNGTPDHGGVDFTFFGNLLWVVTSPGGNVGPVTVTAYADGAPPTVSFTGNFVGGFGALGPIGHRIAVAAVGNKTYVAVLYESGSNAQVIRIFEIDIAPILTTASSFVDVPIADSKTFSNVSQIDFLGDNLIAAVVSASECTLAQFNIPSQTWSTLARFPNTSNLFFCSIAGGLFCLAVNSAAFNNTSFGDTVDMYLVQGGQLQYIGPVIVQPSVQGGINAIVGELEPVAFGPYAIFTIYYAPAGSATTSVQVFAYDVLRGRLFKMQDFGGLGPFFQFNNLTIRRMGVVAPVQRPVTGGTLTAQWSVVVPTLSTQNAAQDVTNVRNLLMGVALSGTGNQFLQTGCQLTSSLIDFTSAENKLYRQVVASFTPLPADTGVTVQLDVWLDQDPANLSAVPTFTTNVVAAGVNGGTLGQVQLKLPLNLVARKLVYRVTTVGPSATLTPAVKLISVAVQAATGWTIHYYLDLSKQARTNGGSAYCFAEQGMDEMAAYNFLRQLWRLKGGECRITLANGDSYPALLQLINGSSPKPFGALETSTTFGQVVEVKFREDV